MWIFKKKNLFVQKIPVLEKLNCLKIEILNLRTMELENVFLEKFQNRNIDNILNDFFLPGFRTAIDFNGFSFFNGFNAILKFSF